MFELRKIGIVKRLSAWFLDAILLAVLTTGFMFLISLICNFNYEQDLATQYFNEWEDYRKEYEYAAEHDVHTVFEALFGLVAHLAYHYEVDEGIHRRRYEQPYKERAYAAEIEAGKRENDREYAIGYVLSGGRTYAREQRAPKARFAAEKYSAEHEPEADYVLDYIVKDRPELALFHGASPYAPKHRKSKSYRQTAYKAD